MKVAIIGGTGLLGSNLLKYYSKKNFEVRAFSRLSSQNQSLYDISRLDFNNLEAQLSVVFDIWCPDIIINAVALVNLQECEDNVKSAYIVNTSIAMQLSSISKKYKSYFIHISTDHFFNDKKLKHTENDEIVLVNNYARTKFEAENEVVKIYSKALVVRTNIVGFRRNNIDSFFEWLLGSLKSQKDTNLYNNFYSSPLSVKQLGNFLINCYDKNINGLFNIASSEVIDKYTFGIETARIFGFNKEKIYSIELENCSNETHRALSLGLDVSKIENVLGVKMPSIIETLEGLYKEYREDNEQ